MLRSKNSFINLEYRPEINFVYQKQITQTGEACPNENSPGLIVCSFQLCSRNIFSQQIFYLTLPLNIQIRFYILNTLTSYAAPQLYENPMKDMEVTLVKVKKNPKS